MTVEQIKFLGQCLTALRVAKSYITYSGDKEATLEIINKVLDRDREQELEGGSNELR